MKRILSFLACALLILSYSLAFASAYTDMLQKKADAGDVLAITLLGYAYATGDGISQDYHKANAYYLKAISHQKWNTVSSDVRGEVYTNLGNNYHAGRGVRQDYHKAVEYYRKAADLGTAEAVYNLGNMYRLGEGVRQDYHKAVEYYRKAADLGITYAMYNLGGSYLNGEGVRQDYRKAKEYYGMACDNGYQKGCDKYRKLNEAGI